MNDALHDLKMPSFGADMEKGTLLEWLVTEGQHIKRGDLIATIETHKGAMDLDVFEDAIVEKLLLEAGQQVSVGTPIAQLRSLENEPHTEQPITQTAAPAATISKPAQRDTRYISKAQQTDGDFVLASPAARRLAAKQQLSLADIAAKNNNKTVTLSMLETALTAPSKDKNTKSNFDSDAMRQAISDTVSRSKREIPHYYLSQPLDITVLEQSLLKHNANLSVESRILLAAPLLCAIARTLLKNKQLNGEYRENTFFPGSTVNLANTINLRGGGLLMPVIRDAQTLTPPVLMKVLKHQVSAARTASLRISELTGATCSVTSIGDRGAQQMFAVIYPPQVAIIALGSAHQQTMVVDGKMQMRSVIEATLAADHRISNGHIGARFLYQLNQQLQMPEKLWDINS